MSDKKVGLFSYNKVDRVKKVKEVKEVKKVKKVKYIKNEISEARLIQKDLDPDLFDIIRVIFKKDLASLPKTNDAMGHTAYRQFHYMDSLPDDDNEPVIDYNARHKILDLAYTIQKTDINKYKFIIKDLMNYSIKYKYNTMVSIGDEVFNIEDFDTEDEGKYWILPKYYKEFELIRYKKITNMIEFFKRTIKGKQNPEHIKILLDKTIKAEPTDFNLNTCNIALASLKYGIKMDIIRRFLNKQFDKFQANFIIKLLIKYNLQNIELQFIANDKLSIERMKDIIVTLRKYKNLKSQTIKQIANPQISKEEFANIVSNLA